MEKKGSNWVRLLPVLIATVVILAVLTWMNRESWFGGGPPVSEQSSTPGGEQKVDEPEQVPSMTDRERAWTQATGSPRRGRRICSHRPIVARSSRS